MLCRTNSKYYWLLVLCLLYSSVHAVCPTSRSGEVTHEVVKYVIDGDTLLTKQGQKIRIIGVDTPELGRHGAADQPFAEEAKAFVKSVLAKAQLKIRLHTGSEQEDRYGRRLADVLLADGRNLAELLLSEGLARVLIYPPNDISAACYSRLERQAQVARRGLWQRPENAVKTVANIRKNQFNRVAGRVTERQDKAGYVRLVIDKRLAVRIAKRDWQSMPKSIRAIRVGDKVTVKGVVHRNKQGLQIRVHHAYAFESRY